MNVTSILDDTQKISQLDESNMLTSAISLPDQIEDAWRQAQTLNLSSLVVREVVVCGMGGSALGAHVVKSVFKHSLTVPLIIVNDYTLPAFVDEQTFVILVSYSGTTEETLAAYRDAKEKHAQMLVMATGGSLIEKAQADAIPFFLLKVTHNPSHQPRMAIGYMIMGLLAMLVGSQLTTLPFDSLTPMLTFLRSRTDMYLTSIDNNPIKQLAYELFDKVIFLVSADHLIGAFHVLNNQINENAKQLTVELHLPELNHHYMEGLTYPKFMPNQGLFLFAHSQLYNPHNSKRLEITEKVVTDAGFMSKTLTMSAGDVLTQAFECIQQGMFLNLYLAFLNGINPAPIPVVDYFKAELKKVVG